jgi:hypothetical protein
VTNQQELQGCKAYNAGDSSFIGRRVPLHQPACRKNRQTEKLKEEVWDVVHADEKDLPAMGSIMPPSLNYNPKPPSVRVVTSDS